MSRILQVAEAGGLTPKRSGPDGYSVMCCFHPERNPSLRLTPSLDSFHCFVCGAKGGYVKLTRIALSAIQGIDLRSREDHCAPISRRDHGAFEDR